jgi:hypothetical protein
MDRLTADVGLYIVVLRRIFASNRNDPKKKRGKTQVLTAEIIRPQLFGVSCVSQAAAQLYSYKANGVATSSQPPANRTGCKFTFTSI